MAILVGKWLLVVMAFIATATFAMGLVSSREYGHFYAGVGILLALLVLAVHTVEGILRKVLK